jgi:uncharacterized LabA/DUF88 family protein
MKRVVILIDGQNLFYGLKDMELMERNINWSNLFKSLIAPNGEDELIRTYWFRPQRILDGHLSSSSIRNQIVYKRYNNYYNDYKTNSGLLPPNVLQAIEQEALKAEEWLKKEKEKFAGIEHNYDQLSMEYGDIEIVKKGIVKVNPYLQQYIGEKGVDISLAVKMMALSVEKKCDKIILVSGDYDYAEAINFVKSNMTKVHIVKLHKGVPPKNRNVSRDLAVLADKVIDVYESELKSIYAKLVV